MSERIRRYLHQNVLGLVAIFIALTGTAIALPGKNTVQSNDIGPGEQVGNGDTKSINGSWIANGSIALDDLASDSVNENKVADGTLEGQDILDPTRSVGIPLASFIDCQTNSGAFLDFTSGVDATPDFQNSSTDGAGFTIRFDADIGSQDEDSEICSQLLVPDDYVSGGALTVRYSKDSPAGVVEQISCAVSVNSGALNAASVDTGPGLPTDVVTCNPSFTAAPGDSLSFYLAVTTDAASINNEVDFHAVRFDYLAEQ